MVFKRVNIVASTLLCAGTALAGQASVPVMESVARNIARAETCLAQGYYAEAQAYARTTGFSQPVRFSVSGDASAVAEEALAKWTDALAGQVTFERVPENEADLNIVFSNNVRTSGRDVMGLATTRRTVHAWSGGQFTARVSGSLEIATVSPLGLPVTRDCQVNTALHEIGHFLGLDDTMERGRVMGPIDLHHPITTPSVAEAASLVSLQDQAKEVARASTDLLASR